MRRLARIFGLGLLTLLPAALILHVLVSFLRVVEGFLGALLAQWLPEGFYFPGMGLAGGLLIILLAGVLASSWLGPWASRALGRRLHRLPLLGRVYAVLSRFAARLSGEHPAGFQEVVFVPSSEGGGRIGLIVSREAIRYSVSGRPLVPVYFPKAFQAGGDLELVPRDQLEHGGMTVDEALGLVLTGGLAREQDRESLEKQNQQKAEDRR